MEKATLSKSILSNNSNGLYLAFTTSVVYEINTKGYLSRSIDSLFSSFIIPKFTSLIPLIANGSKIRFIDPNSEKIPDYLKGIANINIDYEGNIYNKTKITAININIDNKELHNMSNKKNIGILKYIFDKEELRLTHRLRGDIASFLIHNYPDKIIDLLKERFSYIIIDEAQDLKKGYLEDFAKMLYDSPIQLFLLGDDNQNVNGGGKWFESLPIDENKNKSHRCPDNNCKWIRENLGINIYGNSDISKFKLITYSEILKYDNEKRTLLYSVKSGKNVDIIEKWQGPKSTIKSAKGSTIYEDIVILGSTINKKSYYTAITRTKKNVYSTVSKWN